MGQKETVMDLNKLEDSLLEIDNSAMLIPEMHGFFTALIIGPEPITPDFWLPLIFNERGKLPEFRSEKQLKKIINAVFDFYNDTVEEIDEFPDPIIPIIKDDKTGEDLGPGLWCNGFLRGVELDAEGWFGEKDKHLSSLLMPIFYFANKEDFKSVREKTSPEKMESAEKEMLRLIPESILRIRYYWRNREIKKRSRKGNVVPFDKKKTGRNDPCPCGSGKKFKNCCGKE